MKVEGMDFAGAVVAARDATADDGWSPISTPNGELVKVWKRSVPGSLHSEIRISSLIDAPLDKVLQLLETSDETLIRRFNPMYESGCDLQRLGENIKISYARVRGGVPGVKPRDMVTCIAKHELPEMQATALVLRAVEHRDAPPARGCVRAKILKGLHLLQPVDGEEGQTTFTYIQQVDLGGMAVPNGLVIRSAVLFVERLGRVAVDI